MKLLSSDFFYSYLTYYIKNIRPCILIQMVPPGGINYSKWIWFYISNISKNGNIIYIIEYPLPCNGNTDFTYNTSNPPQIDMGLCTSCSGYSNGFGSGQQGFIAIVSQGVQALSTTLYIRITLPPDIT